MIRYVDSCGWTWAVCELADRQTPDAAGAASATPAERIAPAFPLTDRPVALAATLGDADPDDADDELAAPGDLYFFSRLGTRKLRGYPARWAELPRAGLEALCQRARDVGASGVGVMA